MTDCINKDSKKSRRSDPINGIGGLVGRGAVLYDIRSTSRCLCGRQGRCLAHVTGVYEETTTGKIRFEVWSGTHTTQEFVYGDDLLDMFVPAGFSIDVGTKPTYILTREYGVVDNNDLMQQTGEEIEREQRTKQTELRPDTSQN